MQPKEGISLINGTQAMLAIGCLELEAADILADTADVVCAMTWMRSAARPAPSTLAFTPPVRIPANVPARRACAS